MIKKVVDLYDKLEKEGRLRPDFVLKKGNGSVASKQKPGDDDGK